MKKQINLYSEEIEFILEILSEVGTPLRTEYLIRHKAGHEIGKLEKKVMWLMMVSEELASVLPYTRVVELLEKGKKLKNFSTD